MWLWRVGARVRLLGNDRHVTAGIRSCTLCFLEVSDMTVSYNKLTRRELLMATAPAALGLLARPRLCFGGSEQVQEKLPPVRTITRGPKHHWFAYYDKLEFDPTCRYVLGMEVDFEHRSPEPADVIKVGMVDLQNSDKWIELGESRAWCWQQGCMLQWRPGSKTEVLWNDRQGDRLVCHILDVKTGKKRTVPHPIYSVAPNGRWAVASDFRRINEMRTGYGYRGAADPNADELAPKDSGIFRIDLETGARELIVSLADIARIPFPLDDLSEKKHYFNHLLVNPDSTRFEFLHRWAPRGPHDCRTRMLTAAPDGSDIRVLDHSGCTSHFIWRDPKHILAWSWAASRAGAFCLLEDKSGGGKVKVIGGDVLQHDGHCSYLPGGQWILNDTYPDRNRLQHPFLFYVDSGRVVKLGHFYCPPEYRGEWRVDTHPRFSPDGKSVVIDSPHTGEGRQLHLIDIRGIVG